MKIRAAKNCRLAYFQQGFLVRWKYIDENGLFDARGKQYIGKFAEVDELDYYIRALKNSSAILFTEEETKKQLNNNKHIVAQQENPEKIVEEFHKKAGLKR